ncbi:collagen alpha-1(I) chain-like [Pteronotus mesoamericanus]|uniref:collagen alpha-1(I) chain-like n=1 Tax=Pteronotus mesoamericanus TaxID=1884717 RepID=UPI0023ECD5A8|nr:collagen alpha-1(I) chain-like [Pteronotus parnellii mesoamericanus]
MARPTNGSGGESQALALRSAPGGPPRSGPHAPSTPTTSCRGHSRSGPEASAPPSGGQASAEASSGGARVAGGLRVRRGRRRRRAGPGAAAPWAVVCPGGQGRGASPADRPSGEPWVPGAAFPSGPSARVAAEVGPASGGPGAAVQRRGGLTRGPTLAVAPSTHGSGGASQALALPSAPRRPSPQRARRTSTLQACPGPCPPAPPSLRRHACFTAGVATQAPSTPTTSCRGHSRSGPEASAPPSGGQASAEASSGGARVAGGLRVRRGRRRRRAGPGAAAPWAVVCPGGQGRGASPADRPSGEPWVPGAAFPSGPSARVAAEVGPASGGPGAAVQRRGGLTRGPTLAVAPSTHGSGGASQALALPSAPRRPSPQRARRTSTLQACPGPCPPAPPSLRRHACFTAGVATQAPSTPTTSCRGHSRSGPEASAPPSGGQASAEASSGGARVAGGLRVRRGRRRRRAGPGAAAPWAVVCPGGQGRGASPADRPSGEPWVPGAAFPSGPSARVAAEVGPASGGPGAAVQRRGGLTRGPTLAVAPSTHGSGGASQALALPSAPRRPSPQRARRTSTLQACPGPCPPAPPSLRRQACFTAGVATQAPSTPTTSCRGHSRSGPEASAPPSGGQASAEASSGGARVAGGLRVRRGRRRRRAGPGAAAPWAVVCPGGQARGASPADRPSGEPWVPGAAFPSGPSARVAAEVGPASGGPGAAVQRRGGLTRGPTLAVAPSTHGSGGASQALALPSAPRRPSPQRARRTSTLQACPGPCPPAPPSLRRHACFTAGVATQAPSTPTTSCRGHSRSGPEASAPPSGGQASAEASSGGARVAGGLRVRRGRRRRRAGPGAAAPWAVVCPGGQARGASPADRPSGEPWVPGAAFPSGPSARVAAEVGPASGGPGAAVQRRGGLTRGPTLAVAPSTHGSGGASQALALPSAPRRPSPQRARRTSTLQACPGPCPPAPPSLRRHACFTAGVATQAPSTPTTSCRGHSRSGPEASAPPSGGQASAEASSGGARVAGGLRVRRGRRRRRAGPGAAAPWAVVCPGGQGRGASPADRPSGEPWVPGAAFPSGPSARVAAEVGPASGGPGAAVQRRGGLTRGPTLAVAPSTHGSGGASQALALPSAPGGPPRSGPDGLPRCRPVPAPARLLRPR